MIRRLGFLLTLVFGTFAAAVSQEPLNKEQILENILNRSEQNEKLTEDYGFSFSSTERKLDEDGGIKKEQTRSYRIIWIRNEAYAELMEIDGKPLDDKQKKDEQKRRGDFEKKLKENKKESDEDEFEWKDLYEKYEFEMLPAQEGSAYTIAFAPKSTGLLERNRTEKVLNHLKGVLWADEKFNLLKVKASLESSVRFGLGIIAKIDKLDIEYSQRAFQNVYMPAVIRYNFAGRLALLRSERREQITEFHEFYHRE